MNVKSDKLSFDVEDEHAEFNLINTSKFPYISGECHWIEVVDSLVVGTISNNVSNDPLEHCILNDGTSKDENLEIAIYAQFLEASPQVPLTFAQVEVLVNDYTPSSNEKHAPQGRIKTSSFFSEI